MRKVYFLVVLLLAVCTFSACSKDDENSEIVGKWTLVKDYFENEEGEVVEGSIDEYEEGEDIYIFNEDGTGVNEYKYTDSDNNGNEIVKTDKDEFSYTLKDNKLTMIINEGDNVYTENVTVEFSGNKAIVKYLELDEENERYVMEWKKI